MDNNLKEILVYIYFGAIITIYPKIAIILQRATTFEDKVVWLVFETFQNWGLHLEGRICWQRA